MQIRILAVGKKMPAWVTAACTEYGKRLPHNWLNIVEIPLASRHKTKGINTAISDEGKKILAAVNECDKVIALEVKGISWSTEELSQNLASWQMQGDNISLLVGGPDGLSAECLARAHQQWSLSPLTLPHPLVRILLVEQLYRAWSISQNHPYHK